MSANMTSVRMTILNTILQTFQNMQADQPTSDPYGITWSTVQLGPLIKADQKKRYSLGLVAGPQKENFSIPYIMAFLTLNVEVRVTVNSDDDPPGQMIEQAMTVVVRQLTADRTWGGIAIDTKVANLEVDLITWADRSAFGVVVATVQFRYSHLDPRDPNPDFRLQTIARPVVCTIRM